MTEKEFDYMQLGGLVDQRPFIVPGLIGWLQAQADPVHISFLSEMPGVEGVQGIRAADTELPVISIKDDFLHQEKGTFKTIVFNFALSAISGFFTNDKGIGCMMRFGTVARSVFIPYSAMVSIYTLSPVPGAIVFGYHPQATANALCQAITPGMLQALTGKAPEEASVAAPTPQPEEPAPRPSWLTRVK